MAMEKKYDYQTTEQQVQCQWSKEQTYAYKINSDNSFSIDTPPPTVSGSLHIGHIFSYTQTDIVVRYHRLQGRAIFYPFGFDDNGLPTERFVEKQRSINPHSMNRPDFIAICLQETDKAELQFKQLWQRMGLSVDWSRCYSTISPLAQHISQLSFIRLHQKGYVYRKEEAAPYCTTCQTSVAQAELDDVEQPSVFYTLRFITENGAPLMIATTRPELLSSCVAVLYHPDDARYRHLAGSTATVPLFGNKVPLLADEAVIINKGTGLVMCCTFGDTTDISWYKKFSLPYKPSIGLHGRWLESTGILAGLKVTKAREAVVLALKDAGLVIDEKPIIHPVSVHERCHNAIEYLILPQWFLSVLPFRQQLIEEVEKVAWYPSFMKSRCIHWIENLRWDWCLSRQRFYGIPFPAWHCSHCKYIKLADENQLPIDPTITTSDDICPACGKTTLVPDRDVMDTWNTSSLTPYLCKALLTNNAANVFDEPYEPMTLRPQAHDIIRTWAFYTLVKTWMHHQTIPWKTIAISGHVLSNEKKKISKSKANSNIEPLNLLQTYAADAIRYWTASAKLGYDVAFSEEQLKIGNRLLVKLWNAFLFIKEHTNHSEQPLHASSGRGVMNEWILHKATECFERYQRYFDQYEISLAIDCVEHFFWSDVCDNYLELIKDQLFNPHLYSQESVTSTQITLREIGLRILQLYAPFVPHITEKIYQELYKQATHPASLHLSHYRTVQKAYQNSESMVSGNMIIQLVTAMRKLKSDHQLSLKADIATLTLTGNEQSLRAVKNEEQLIKGITRAQQITYHANGEQTTRLEQSDGHWHAQVHLT